MSSHCDFSPKSVDATARAEYDKVAVELPANSVPGAADQTVFDGTSASDHDLEMIAYGAYSGAYGQAVRHHNVFSSADMTFGALRSAYVRESSRALADKSPRGRLCACLAAAALFSNFPSRKSPSETTPSALTIRA